MKNNSTENEKSIEAMLAEMPIEPRGNFTEKVLGAIHADDAQIDALLKTQPLTVPADFANRVLAECVPAKKERRNTIAFATKFIAAAAAIALIAVPAIFQTGISPENKSAMLANEVAQVLENDPELYALAQADAEDEMSLAEFIKASEVLTSINPTTIEILAYNE